MTYSKPSDPEPIQLSTAVGVISLSQEGSPSNPAILCIHGIPGSRRDFRYLAPYVRESFQVIRLDLPGFGDSPLLDIDTAAGWADTINAVADALELKHYFLLAHSFGGGAVIQAASRWPDRVAGLVLLASIGHRRHRGYGNVPPALYYVLYRVTALPFIRLPLYLITRYQYRVRGLRPPEIGEWPVIRRQLRLISSVDFAFLGHCAGQISAQSLIVHCDDDHLVERSIAQELAELMPRSKIHHFPTGGHFLQKTRAAEIGALMSTTFAQLDYHLQKQ